MEPAKRRTYVCLLMETSDEAECKSFESRELWKLSKKVLSYVFSKFQASDEVGLEVHLRLSDEPLRSRGFFRSDVSGFSRALERALRLLPSTL